MSALSLPICIENHLYEAQALAESINNPKDQNQLIENHYYQSPHYYNNYCMGPYYPMWGQRTVVHNHYGTSNSGSSSSKNNGGMNKDAALAALALVVVTGTLAYLFGKEYNLYKNAANDESILNQKQNLTWVSLKETNQNPIVLNKMMDIFDTEKSIFNSYKQESSQRAILKATTALGTGAMMAAFGKAAFAGSATMLVAPSLLTAGAVAATCGAIGWALYNGFNDTQSDVSYKAKQLSMQIQDLKQTYLYQND